MGHRLFLHIGTHKTGTTAIQSFLYENRDRLRSEGYSYPDFEEERLKNGANISPDYGKNANYLITEDYTIDENANNYVSAIKRIKNDLEDYDVILSDENLILDQFLEKILFLLTRDISNVFVILYLRRQDFLIESLWNQRIKGGGTHYSLEEYIAKDLPKWTNYKDLLDRIEKFIPKTNIIVRVYEREQFYQGVLISDFLHAIGLETDLGDWERGNDPNFRLKGNYLEIKRVINEINVVEPFPSYSWKEQLTQLSEYYGEEDKQSYYFDEISRHEFLNTYQESNKQVAQRYYNRLKLFNNENCSYAITNYPNILSESSVKDTIRLFALLLTDMHNKVSRLESINKANVNALISIMSGGRRIYLWGAGGNCPQVIKKLSNEISGIVDSDASKAGKTVLGNKIFGIEEMGRLEGNFYIITPTKSESIESFLLEKKLVKWRDYCVAKEMGILE